mgnify:CR=1 FL=1
MIEDVCLHRLRRTGAGMVAVERRADGQFLGGVGLSVVPWYPDDLQLGWRLVPAHWGHGYATEAAALALRHAFAHLHLRQVVSFTVPANRRSRAVMERLGMTRSPADDFDHPKLPVGHPLRRHVLYRLRRP